MFHRLIHYNSLSIHTMASNFILMTILGLTQLLINSILFTIRMKMIAIILWCNLIIISLSHINSNRLIFRHILMIKHRSWLTRLSHQVKMSSSVNRLLNDSTVTSLQSRLKIDRIINMIITVILLRKLNKLLIPLNLIKTVNQ